MPVRRQRRARRKRRLPEHAPAVVEYVYKSRFVVASQVQRRFESRIHSSRTVQHQLAALVDAGYLGTAPVRSTAPNFPFVYFATGRGVGLVNDAYARLGSSVRHAPGEGTKRRGLALQGILHELMTTEVELQIRRMIDGRPDLKLLQTERRYFRRERRLRFSERGKTETVVPDAGFLLVQEGGGAGTSHNVDFASKKPLPRWGIQYFVEFDAGTMPPARFGEKLRRYARWADSADGRQYLERLYGRFGLPVPQTSFRLLVIALDKLHELGDEKRLAGLYKQALRLPAAMRDRLWFATAADLAAQSDHSPTPEPKIWLRGRAGKALGPGNRPQTEQKSNAPRRTLIADQLPLLPRHRLLPSPLPQNETALLPARVAWIKETMKLKSRGT